MHYPPTKVNFVMFDRSSVRSLTKEEKYESKVDAPLKVLFSPP